MAEVLVVDDDPDIRMMLRFALEDVGFDVRLASDGVEALALLRERVPDCMVLDLMMPNLDGFGLLRTMHATGLGDATRTVILTCKVDEGDVVTGLELGAHEYLTKPFDPDRLAGILQRLLDTTPQALADRRRTQLDKAALRERIEATLAPPRRRADSLPRA
ncbi:MAG: response regulator [Actinobacteria bacterium]|nr:MAG: response regulator [Actinomycetota bacterium]